MAGRAKKMLKDLLTGQVYESLYAAGKVIGPAEYAAGTHKNPAGKIKQDQHVWFAIHRDKENLGRFEVSTDGGATFVAYPFTPSKRKSAAERKVSDAAKAEKAAAKGNGTSAASVPAGETKEARIARLRAELAGAEAAEVTAPVEAEESLPPKGKLAGAMKVAKTA
jgi:hypothetical protein